jgi:hypothetical protein
MTKSFEEIRWILKNKLYHKLTRTYEMTRAYEMHKKILSYRGVTTSDHVKDILKGQKTAVTWNRFPYDVDAFHLIVWFDNRITAMKTIRKVFKGLEYLYYQSPPELRSVPGKKHYHVFVRKNFISWLILKLRIK